ncbi:hypothetical protein [Anaeromyxobacter terrae]|uniref:hypothetical protein n=1 Tax=Anaeromyxobacter terrae TaxID=2925406 RepID=UPI001F57CAAC|nr:hypothetical protein [Anaeromyxobacter sp. SG22]
MRRAHLLIPALLALAACAPHAAITDAERTRVHQELDGQQRYLRVAAYVAPFWGDRSKMLLTDQAPAELDVIETTGGTAIAPPTPERILPPGTAVRLREVEFPTGWLIARRVVMTPRYSPWVYVETAGETRPLVVVLPQTAANYADVRAEVEQILSVDDPSSFFRNLPQDQRAAILKKEPIEGMSPRALEMAWGLPEKKRIDRPAGTEEWSWAGGKRRAFLQDDRLVRWER